MTKNAKRETLNFSDVQLQEQPDPLITCRSGMVVYYGVPILRYNLIFISGIMPRYEDRWTNTVT